MDSKVCKIMSLNNNWGIHAFLAFVMAIFSLPYSSAGLVELSINNSDDLLVSEDEIIHLYHESSVAVIPSLYEGFGFGAGEAMACGVPLVSTHSGGLKDVVGDCALKIQPKSSEEIEKAVMDLFQNPEQRKELAKKGRERMEELFDWKIAAKSYVAVFQEVIESFKNEHNKV